VSRLPVWFPALLGPVGVLVLPIVLLTVVGCASQGGEQLTLKSQRRGQTLSQPVAGAFLARGAGGDTDLVLLDTAARQALEGGRTDAPVREVMHIRVLWNPARDLKADHSSASNATIHWYVIGNRRESAADVLEYAGTGFVLLDEAQSGTELTIRDAAVRPVACHGKLCDPLGPCNLQGTLRVVADQQRVRQALWGVRAAVAAANTIPNKVAYRPKPERPSSLAR